ncbi:hypothetical protein EVA_20667 [gut metagenome]|uniref:Uncharacterized protein n=1 Tax=gut metagenome TaxID=749906 RepID=J9F9U9_9ZZZZ
MLRLVASILSESILTTTAVSFDIDDYAEFGLNEADAPEASWTL